MKLLKSRSFPLILLFLVSLVFFKDFVFFGKLPIPADTIVGMYYPFRNINSDTNPNGIPFKNFMVTDPIRQQYPWKELAVSSLKKGEIPVWNPYNFGGSPLLANFQTAVFYPLNFLFFIFDFNIAWSLLILSQPLLASVFMFLFLRNFKLSSVSSLFGAVSFAFSGFFISWLEWGNIVSTALWLPLILLSIDKIFAKRSIYISVLLFALMSSFFAGHLQSFFYLFSVSSAYLLFRFSSYKNIKNFYSFGIVFLLFLLFTSIQSIPTLNFVSNSARGIDQDWHKEGWFVPWENAVQFISPDFFGNPATLNYYGTWNYGEFIGYVGLPALVFAIFSLFYFKNKNILFFALILFFAIIFAFPTLIAKVPFKFSFPFLSTSMPTRLMFVIDFSLATLAAFGLDIFIKRGSKKIIFPIAIVSSVIVFLWVFVLLGGFGIYTAEEIAVSMNNLKLPTITLLTLFLVLASFSLKRFRNVFILLILVLLVFDLYRFGWKYLPFSENKYLYPEEKTISFIKDRVGIFRIMSTDSRILPPNFSAIYRIQTLDGYDPLYLFDTAEVMAAISRGSNDIHQPFGFNRIITPQNYRPRMMDLLGVKYVVSMGEINPLLPKLKKVFEDKQIIVYENKKVFPRAFFVKKTVVENDKQKRIDLLFDPNTKLREVAYIEGHQEMNKDWDFNGKVKFLEYSENKVILETENNGKGFLVLTDVFYPNWKAKASGKNLKIHKVNHILRGVVVPAGKQRIEFYASFI